jgi:predicted signal transduction protein with EAL and GGDEF domain
MDRQGVTRLLGLLFGVVAVALIGWSGWLYHFAPAADTTDATTSFWIAIGTLALVGGLLSLRIALRLLRWRPRT